MPILNEDTFKLIAQPYIEACRDGDWDHAKRVVKWTKVLGKGREDLPLLISAAYIHDIGWNNILPKGKLNLKKMLEFEEKANKNSERLVREMLNKAEFNEAEVTTVLRLIKAADDHKSQHDDEAIIVDADSLSKLCVEHVKEKYAKESYNKVIKLWEKEFPTRFKTKKGKEIYPELLENLKKNLSIKTN